MKSGQKLPVGLCHVLHHLSTAKAALLPLAREVGREPGTPVTFPIRPAIESLEHHHQTQNPLRNRVLKQCPCFSTKFLDCVPPGENLSWIVCVGVRLLTPQRLNDFHPSPGASNKPRWHPGTMHLSLGQVRQNNCPALPMRSPAAAPWRLIKAPGFCVIHRCSRAGTDPRSLLEGFRHSEDSDTFVCILICLVCVPALLDRAGPCRIHTKTSLLRLPATQYQ